MKQNFVRSLGALCLAGSLCAAEPDPAALSEAEWTEYRFERLTVVRTNSDLAAESKQIQEEAQDQEEAVETAMVKADPAVAPLLVKRKALLKGNWYAPAESDMLSWRDWQTLRAARVAALEAAPDLVASGEALKEKKQNFEAKVHAALAREDPSLAPLIQTLGIRGAGRN